MAGTQAQPQASGELELLSQMIEEISGELALEPLLTRIAERAVRLTGADDAMIGLYDPAQDVLRTVATSGLPISVLAPHVPRGHGLAGQVLALDGPVRGRYGDLPLPLATESPDRFVLGVPIRARGALLGVFSLAAWAPGVLDAHAQAVLEQFARHAGIAIDNASRYTREATRANRFELIAKVAAIIASAPELDALLQRTADAIHEVLEYPNVDIPLLDPDAPHELVIRVRGGDYKRLIRHEDRLSLDVGIMGAAVRERRTQLANDLAADPRYVQPPGVIPAGAELAVPIVHGGEVLGVVNVEGPGPFDALDVRSLEVVAETLGVAIVNARLQQRMRAVALVEERQRLARDLHDNVSQVLSSISLISQSLPDAFGRDVAEGRRRASRLAELAQLGFGELRAMLHELSPDHAMAREPAPVGLDRALPRLLAAMVPPHIHLDVHVDAFPTQSSAREAAILRVCQEAVSNAVRHSGARRIDVGVHLCRERIRLLVCDDGCGIPDSPTPGMGLTNMQRRIDELGGTLRIARRRGGGTRIEACMPRTDDGGTP